MKIKAFWKKHWLKLVLGLIVLCTALGVAFIGTAGTEQQTASAAAYTAKGSFTFATAIASDPFECSVNFTSNNISFNKIEVRLNNSDYQVIYTHTSSISSDMSLMVYNDGWTATAYRTIDFGDTAVDITERLYLFLDNCAAEGADGQLSNVSSYVVEGTWRFNSTPSLSGGSRSQTLTNTYIISANFLREAITKITVSSSGISYTINGSMTGDMYTTSWSNDKARYIFFESPVTLSASFYEWFTDNASQLSAVPLYNRLTIQVGNADTVSTQVNTGSVTWGTISITSNKQLYLPVFDGTLTLGVTVFSPEGYELKSVIPTNATVSNLNGQLGIFNLSLPYNKSSQIVINVESKESGGESGEEEPEGPEDGTKVITPGYYEYNENFTLPDVTYENAYSEEITFIANGTLCTVFTVDSSQIKYGSGGTIAYNPAWGGWMNGFDDQILIQNNQSVSKGFYEWFTANVTPLNNEDSYLAGFEDGKEQGYQDGFKTGKEQGYNQGYYDGLKDTEEYSFMNLLTAVVDAPVTVFVKLLDFEILGWNMSTVIISLLSVCLIVTLIGFFSGKK